MGSQGFSELARRIPTFPDYEIYIFRKFGQLSARNLLHLESRLAYSEEKLRRADAEAGKTAESNNEALRSLNSWEAFKENARDLANTEHTHMILAEETKEALKEDRKTLFTTGIVYLLNMIGRRNTTSTKPDSHARSAQKAGSRRLF
ncbi:hypothetical protein BS50DRAFT_588461 [Corynespora cassiicola Philippines]|uniref:DUF6594 domain-containing protein n=1 Tax=Corynespora cassiicola Philippines TaxID=1448308 RepID=A0A2T2NPY8_CORCC|nr:hypothetical protein BS50DRAFT_588461 [Corynespora cassiicola Philippines]